MQERIYKLFNFPLNSVASKLEAEELEKKCLKIFVYISGFCKVNPFKSAYKTILVLNIFPEILQQ